MPSPPPPPRCAPRSPAGSAGRAHPPAARRARRRRSSVRQQHEHELEAAPDADDLVGPDDPGRARRLAKAEFMRRAYACDVLVCTRCGGAMRLIVVVQDAAVCEKILRHLRLWSRGSPRSRHVVVEPGDHEPSYVD
jgi:hypothetical protein